MLKEPVEGRTYAEHGVVLENQHCNLIDSTVVYLKQASSARPSLSFNGVIKSTRFADFSERTIMDQLQITSNVYRGLFQ